jgi:hypothetical protein
MGKHPHKPEAIVNLDLGREIVIALNRMREATGCPKSEYIRRVLKQALSRQGYLNTEETTHAPA